MAKTKYGKNILSNAAKEIEDDRGNKKIAMFSHEGELKVDCSIGYHCISEALNMPTPPHSHDCDQLLCFIGGNPQNLADFGAEIELCLGEEQEKYIITAPTMINITAGLAHCPLTVTRCDKPNVMLEISLTSAFDSSEMKERREKEEAEKEEKVRKVTWDELPDREFFTTPKEVKVPIEQ